MDKLTLKGKFVYYLITHRRTTHYECEDCWYSCPKSESYCHHESGETECNCGMDKTNSEIDALLKELEE